VVWIGFIYLGWCSPDQGQGVAAQPPLAVLHGPQRGVAVAGDLRFLQGCGSHPSMEVLIGL